MTERLLVFRTGHLGDMIVALPALWAIRRQWPGAHLTLLSDAHPGSQAVLGSEIFRGAGLFDAFEHYDVPAPGARGFRTAVERVRLLMRLRGAGFATLFYLAPSIRTPEQVERDRRFFKAAGLQKIYGIDHFPPVPYGSKAPLPAAGHEADLLLARLRADGLEMPAAGQGSLELGLGPTEARAVDAWLAALPGDGERRWIGLGPASKMPSKRWPLERFREVVAALVARHDVWPVIFGGPEEKATVAPLLAAWGRGFNAAGALGLREAASALKRCALFLGNDSGAMHLAAAAGVPCVAVFSSRDWPGAWYPYGVEQRVFRSAIDCEGCYLEECLERRNECLDRVSVDEVLLACEGLLAQPARRAAAGAER
jgi:ADP-heptose:LPS heptosyltransferase